MYTDDTSTFKKVVEIRVCLSASIWVYYAAVS